MKTQIVIIILIGSLGLGLKAFEKNKKNKSITDSSNPQGFFLPDSNDPAADSDYPLSALTPDQYFNTFIMVEVFRNYTAERMEKAISVAYDENIFSNKEAFEIMSEMSDLINNLRDSETAEVIFEDRDLISLKLTKGDEEYVLTIFFKKSSEKIEKMKFDRFG